MAYFKRHLIWAVSLIFFCGLALPKACAADPVANQIEVRFSVFGTKTYEGLAYLSATTEKPVPLKFYSVELSSMYSYKGEPTIKFYDLAELTAALAEQAEAKKANLGAPVPELNAKPVAVCAFPGGMQRAVLLFFPRGSDKDKAASCEIFAMDMGNTRVPPGHMVFINASGHEFAAQINSEVVKLSLGVSQPFGAEKGKISIKLARLEPEYQSTVSSDIWRLTKNQRRLCVFFPMKNSKEVLPDVRCLIDNLPSDGKEVGMQTASIEGKP